MSELNEVKQWLEETKDKPLEEMAQFFERRVDSYEEKMNPWKPYYEWIGELIPDTAKSVLDLGCGTGLEVEEIYKRHPEVAVTGIDLSGAMLAKLADKYPDKKMELICGDYFSIPLGKEKYDVAVTFETLHHVTKDEKVHIFKKIREALKQDGCYIHGDYIAESEEMEKYLFRECKQRKEIYQIAEDQFVHFETPLTLAHEMEALWEAGFSEVQLLGYRGRENTPMIMARV